MAVFTLSPSGLFNKSIDTSKFSGVDPTFISRYLLLAGILRAYQMHQGLKRLKVLDVGGAGSILNQFIDADITIIDMLPNIDKTPNYIQANALVMPLADKSFDAVISSDVLEHIPKADREKFLKESARITKDLMILAAPFNLDGVRDAEISANNFYKQMTGEDHRWLVEHLQDDLPELRRASLVLGHAGMHTSHFSHTSLDNWQLVTRAGFLLAFQEKHPKFTDIIRRINEHYLEHIMTKDFSETGYRSFIVASKKHEVDVKSEPDIFKPELEALFSLLTESMLALV